VGDAQECPGPPGRAEWQGTATDLELDDSDHEPDDRGDLSFGATTPDEVPPRQVRRARPRLLVYASTDERRPAVPVTVHTDMTRKLLETASGA
jgi:hypothetical protein